MRLGSTLSGALLGMTAALVTVCGSRADDPPAPDPTTTVEGVTVIGPGGPDPEQLPSIVFKFVQSHGAPGRIGQLSRWAIPVCPKTVGLPEAFNAFVSARVVAVASQVGAPGAKAAACAPNLLIVFTTEPQKLLDNVRKDYPELLGFHYAAQTKRLATFNRPIQAWYVTGTKAVGGLVETDAEFERPPSGSAGSRLTSRLRSQFLAALIVVDTTKVVDHEVGAIADHVAMLSLARPSSPRPCGELSSILDVMNPDCASDRGPDAITPYDLAYLKALYGANPEEHLSAQQGRIVSRMVRELKGR